MNRNFWAQACNAALSRPLPELRHANSIANGFAVGHLPLSGCQCDPRLTPTLDLHLLFCRRVQRGILFAGLQAAALEAE